MPHRDPTIRSRELGEGLREAMQGAGLNGKQTAQLLEVTPSYVSMLLAGKRWASELDIATFLGVCRVTGAERERLLALCREQDTPGWFQQHGSRLPQHLATLIDHENKAVTISDFEAIFVPGLLQTGEYARAVVSGNVNVPPDEVDDRVAARLARQSLFSRERPAMAGAFRLMEFAEFTPVAYLESEIASVFFEKPEEIQAYRTILGALDETALDEGQSRQLIAAVATGLYADGEGP